MMGAYKKLKLSPLLAVSLQRFLSQDSQRVGVWSADRGLAGLRFKKTMV